MDWWKVCLEAQRITTFRSHARRCRSWIVGSNMFVSTPYRLQTTRIITPLSERLCRVYSSFFTILENETARTLNVTPTVGSTILGNVPQRRWHCGTSTARQRELQAVEAKIVVEAGMLDFPTPFWCTHVHASKWNERIMFTVSTTQCQFIHNISSCAWVNRNNSGFQHHHELILSRHELILSRGDIAKHSMQWWRRLPADP